MLVETFHLILALGALILPGWLVCARIGLLNRPGSLGLVLVFSMAGIGAFQYGMSFIFPHPNLYLLLLVIGSLIGIILTPKKRNETGWKIPALSPTTASFWAAVGIFALALSFIAFHYPTNSFDDMSYHLPFIESFAEKGSVPLIAEPMNEYERRVNGYPKFFEALVGSIQSLSPLAAAQIPAMIWVSFALLVHFVSARFGTPSPLGALLVGTSILVIPLWVSFYVDGFMAVLLLAVAALVLEKKTPWLETGVLVGAFMATKLTAPLYIIPVAVTLFLFFRQEIRRSLFPFLGVVLLSGGFEAGRWVSAVSAQYSIPVGKLLATGGNLGNTVVSTVQMILGVLFSMRKDSIMIALLMTGLALLLFAGRKRTTEEKRNGAILAGIAGLPILGYFILVFVFHTQYFTSFFRYLIPAFAVGSIFPSIEWARHMENKASNRRLVAGGLALLLIGLSLGPALGALKGYSFQRSTENSTMDKTMAILRDIPPGSTIYFANTPNPLAYGLDDKTIRDYTSYSELDDPPCASLQTKGVTHLLVFFTEMDRPELGKVNDSIVRAAREENCGRTLAEVKNFFRVYDLGK